MRRHSNPAVSVLGLLLLVVAVASAFIGLFVGALLFGEAIATHFRPFLNQPAYPMTWGELIATVLVLVVLLSFRRK